MRIVVLGDSLALPRPADTNPGALVIPWEKTWPALLAADLSMKNIQADVINCSTRARTVDTLIGDDFTEHILFKRPDQIIIQVGVVDCAPRIISKRERELLNLRFVPRAARQWVIDRRAKRRALILRKNPLKRVYTPRPLFQKCLRIFSERLKALPWQPTCTILPVVGNYKAMNEKSPGFEDNLRLYNEDLKFFANQIGGSWIDYTDGLAPNDLAACFWDDGYHLSEIGNQVLAKKIAAEFTRN